MLVNPSHLQRETTVSSSGSAWLRSMAWNSFGITSWVANSPCWWIMHPCSGCSHRRWKIFWPDGPWQSRNKIITLSIARVSITVMPTHYPRKVTAHSMSLLRVSHCQLQWRTSGKVKRAMLLSKRSASPYWHSLEVPKTGSGESLCCDSTSNCGQSWSWLRT